MKILYFDIDGTILPLEEGGPKPALARGALGRAVLAAGFERLVCVGQIVANIRLLEVTSGRTDGLGMVFSLCAGAFDDADWFRQVCCLVDDPDRRAVAIDLEEDWWYVDDLADVYCARAGMQDVYRAHNGGRIHRADPDDDGSGLLAWLQAARA